MKFLNKKNIILVLIGIMILLVGCESDSSTEGTHKTFIGGTDSIKFEFMEETPPNEVYDGGQQPFEVTVSLENEGEYDVPLNDIKVLLSGFYPSDFGNPNVQKNPDENLDKSYIDADGEIERGTITYVNFPGFNFGGSLAGNNEYVIRAEICYKYGTIAQADLCVLEDLTPDEDEEEVCEVDDQKSIDVSSAPIQIENFKEEVAGTRKIKFSFDMVHRSNGLISQLGTDCSKELIDEDKVWVEVDSGLSGLSCSGLESGTSTTGYTKMYGGKRKVICMQDVTSVTGDFEKKVNILLKYDYKEHEERDILVKHTTN
jgi:hypothetical protein